MTRKMEEVLKDIPRETSMRENFSKENPTEKVFLPGQMEKCLKVSGIWGSRKVKEFGKASLEIRILVNGTILKLTVTEYISGKMVTDMKENGLMG